MLSYCFTFQGSRIGYDSFVSTLANLDIEVCMLVLAVYSVHKSTVEHWSSVFNVSLEKKGVKIGQITQTSHKFNDRSMLILYTCLQHICKSFIYICVDNYSLNSQRSDISHKHVLVYTIYII